MATATALFVIDIQNDLATDPETRIPHAERILEAGVRILAAARATIAAAPRASTGTAPTTIVFVQHEEKPTQGPLVRGSEPWKLVFEPDAAAPSERLVAKWTGDTFESNPDLARSLREAGVREIVAFGIQSECCVEATCKGALAGGFEVTLLSGAHSTYNGKDRSAWEIETEVEERLRGKGARIVPWLDAVAAWERTGKLSCDEL